MTSPAMPTSSRHWRPLPRLLLHQPEPAVAINYSVLKQELLTDPHIYGYSGLSNNDQIAGLLNGMWSATLAAAIPNGVQVTILSVNALVAAVPASAPLFLVSGGTSGQVTVGPGGAAVGANSIPIVSVTSNGVYATTSLVCREQITQTTLPTSQLQSAVVASEYAALTGNFPTLWETLILSGGGRVDISNQGIRNQIGAIWGAGTQTRANLLQMQFKAGSRGEALFGIGTVVSGNDVATAFAN